jgi:ribosomal protein S18 acetylase RimI-like enzyme
MVQAIIEKTHRFVIATLGDRIIGMGRAISDGVSDAYIQDVTVHPDLRGKGIGKAIIRKLVEQLQGWPAVDRADLRARLSGLLQLPGLCRNERLHTFPARSD